MTCVMPKCEICCCFMRFQRDSGVLLRGIRRIDDESLTVAQHTIEALVSVCIKLRNKLFYRLVLVDFNRKHGHAL